MKDHMIVWAGTAGVHLYFIGMAQGARFSTNISEALKFDADRVESVVENARSLVDPAVRHLIRVRPVPC